MSDFILNATMRELILNATIPVSSSYQSIDLPCLAMRLFTDPILPHSHSFCNTIRPWNITLSSYTVDLINQTFIDRVCLHDHEPWCRRNDAGLPEFNGKQMFDHLIMFEVGTLQGLWDATLFFVHHPFVFLASWLFLAAYGILVLLLAMMAKELFIICFDDVYVAIVPRWQRIKQATFWVKGMIVVGFLLYWSFSFIHIVYTTVEP
jgi:hypothetical protein